MVLVATPYKIGASVPNTNGYAAQFFMPVMAAGLSKLSTEIAKNTGVRVTVSMPGTQPGDFGYGQNPEPIDGHEGITDEEVARGVELYNRVVNPEGVARDTAHAIENAGSWFADFGQRVLFLVLGVVCIAIALVFLLAPQTDNALNLLLKYKGLGALDRHGRGGDGGGGGDIPKTLTETPNIPINDGASDPRPDFGGNVIDLVPDRTAVEELNRPVFSTSKKKLEKSGGRLASEIFADAKKKNVKTSEARSAWTGAKDADDIAAGAARNRAAGEAKAQQSDPKTPRAGPRRSGDGDVPLWDGSTNKPI